MSSELNILAKAREDREDSEESGLEEAEANAPHGWPGTGKLMVIGSGHVERRLCDCQGLCSPGAWALEHRNYPSSQLWKSFSRLFLGTAESVSSVQLLSDFTLGCHGKSPFSEDVVRKLRDEVKGILVREGIQFERVEGDRRDVPIYFRLLGEEREEGVVASSRRPGSFRRILRARCTGRPGIQNATLPETLHEEEKVADPGEAGNTRCAEQELPWGPK